MPDRDPEKKREYNRRFRAKRRARGICLSCKQPARVGMQMCGDCAVRQNTHSRRWAKLNDRPAPRLMPDIDRAKQREAERRFRERRRARGVCIACGKKNPRVGIEKCGDCAARHSAYQAQLPQWRKAYYEARKAGGLCVTCGGTAAPERTQCSECLARTAERSRKITKLRKAQGLCTLCGGAAPVSGKKMCSDCLVRNVSRGRSRRKRRVALGLCIHCAGDKPSRPGRQGCIDCGIRIAERARDRQQTRLECIADLEKQVKDLTHRLAESHAQAQAKDDA